MTRPSTRVGWEAVGSEMLLMRLDTGEMIRLSAVAATCWLDLVQGEDVQTTDITEVLIAWGELDASPPADEIFP